MQQQRRGELGRQLIERELFAGRSIGYVGDLEKKIEALTGISSKEWMEWFRQKPKEARP